MIFLSSTQGTLIIIFVREGGEGSVGNFVRHEFFFLSLGCACLFFW